MPKPFTQDLRDRVLAAYDRGKQTKEIATTIGVSPAYARRVKQVRREQKRTTHLPMGGVRVVKVDMQQLRHLVEKQPDATIAELHELLGKKSCSESAVAMALQRLDLSFKKRRFMLPSRTAQMLLKSASSGKASSPRKQRLN